MFLEQYTSIWLVDFEFYAQQGNQPDPLCMVAREFRSGRTIRRWLSENPGEPIGCGPNDLYVAYYASAELGCHLALGWSMPVNVIDLYVEFRNLTNGRYVPCGRGLLGALSYFGCDVIQDVEKDSMRQLAMRGGEYTDQEQSDLINYCESDVAALVDLLTKMGDQLDIERALLRGRYMKAVAHMEWTGVPVDCQLLERLRGNWDAIKSHLIDVVDADYHVFISTGQRMSFSESKFSQWLFEHGIHWPRLNTGRLALDDETFRKMANRYPEVGPLRELRHSLGQLRLTDFAVGSDGRNRCLLSPFQAKTGRNQPSNSKFIFGPSAWLRSLIKPKPGWAIAYVDWSQQEFGIGAALSDDDAMMSAYESGDPYLEFAKQAGAVPFDATKASHPVERAIYKQTILAVQYGMGPESLAVNIGQTPAHARELLHLHRSTYRKFWRWSDAAVNHALVHGTIRTVFGWMLHVASEANVRSLANFPCQANGAEMMRLAATLLTERGVSVCCPVHDAFLVEGLADEMEAVVAATRQSMSDASAVVLDGFRLRTDVEIVHSPDRYFDERGRAMFDRMNDILVDIENSKWELPDVPNDGCVEPTTQRVDYQGYLNHHR
ncbi:DNA polymerase [Gimesia sp.]|uniref:DNA polymerase n=1 Tax=Gimesia sp. TaxID=2024833 RepID=UPI003A8DDF9B